MAWFSEFLKTEKEGLSQPSMASSAASRAREAAAEALDRRVRPILDQIDLRNYKQAIKLADTAIKKYGDHPLYQTVKALAMERMGRKQDALELVNTVRAGPLNEHVSGGRERRLKSGGCRPSMPYAHGSTGAAMLRVFGYCAQSSHKGRPRIQTARYRQQISCDRTGGR